MHKTLSVISSPQKVERMGVLRLSGGDCPTAWMSSGLDVWSDENFLVGRCKKQSIEFGHLLYVIQYSV